MHAKLEILIEYEPDQRDTLESIYDSLAEFVLSAADDFDLEPPHISADMNSERD